MRRDRRYDIPYESTIPPPGDGETGVSLPSSPSNISITESALARSRGLVGILILFLMLAAVYVTPVAGADDTVPPITVELDHDEADTWSSVLVTVRVSPVVINNVTYMVQREVRLTLVDLDMKRVLVTAYVNVSYGIGVFNFRILPDWGEFLMEVKAHDHNLTRHTAVARLKVVYSTDWIIYDLSHRFEAIALGTAEDNADAVVRQERLTWIMFLIVFVLLTVALLRLEHRDQRKLGRSSFWDRIWDRSFNYTIEPALYHYLEDEAYGFSTVGRKSFRKMRLEFGQEMVHVDLAVLRTIDKKFDDEIGKLTEKKGEKGDDTETKDKSVAS